MHIKLCVVYLVLLFITCKRGNCCNATRYAKLFARYFIRVVPKVEYLLINVHAW